MSRSVTKEFSEAVLRSVVESPRGCRIDLPKSVLLAFGPEERAFIEKHIQRYYRYSKGRVVIRPKSLQHFLTDKKYAMSDVAEVYLSINDLVEGGYASVVEKDGFWYWSVGGELVDPREHRELYKMDERTFRTLMKEFGYLDIYDEFKDIIKPVSSLFGSLTEFYYMGVKFEIYEDSLMASTNAKFSGGAVAIDTNILDNNARISVKVGKPTLRDVHRAVEHVKGLASIALEHYYW